MNPLNLIPAPWSLVAKIGLPILAIAAAWFAGDLHGERAGRAAVAAKYQPVMERATATLTLSAERIRRARAEAAAVDLANARRVELAQAEATQEIARDYDQKLAAARALAADYARRLRDDAQGTAGTGGGGSAAGQPQPALTAGAADRAGAMPVLDDGDLQICSENTVKALAWPEWWEKVEAIER